MSNKPSKDLSSSIKKRGRDFNSIINISDQDNSAIDSNNSLSVATTLEKVSSYGSEFFSRSDSKSPSQLDPMSVSAISLDSHFGDEREIDPDPELFLGNIFGMIKANPKNEGSQNINAQRQISAIVSEIHGMLRSSYYQDPDLKCHSSDFSAEWKFVSDSRHIKNTCGFYGQVWVNHTEETLVFVFPGTKNDFTAIKGANWQNLYGLTYLLKDLINDLQLSGNVIPIQYSRGAERFIDELGKSKILSNYKSYKVICAGHSLGSTLADLSALYLHKFDIFESIESITLENPGTDVLMSKHMDDLQKRNLIDSQITLESIRNKFNVINNKPNFINTYENQFGDVYINEIESVPVSYETNDDSYAISKDSKNFRDDILSLMADFKSHVSSKEEVVDLVHQVINGFITGLEERYMNGFSYLMSKFILKHIVSDSIKHSTHELMTFMEHLFLHKEYHGDRHYESLNCISFEEKWPVGVFSDIFAEKMNNARSKIDAAVGNSKMAANTLKKLDKIVDSLKQTTVSAGLSLNENLHKFCEFLDSDRPISEFFTDEINTLYGNIKERAISSASIAKTCLNEKAANAASCLNKKINNVKECFNDKVEELYLFKQDLQGLILGNWLLGENDLGLGGDINESFYLNNK